MKKLIALFLAVALLLCLSACNKVDTSQYSHITQAKQECSEQEIRQLIEKNLDCYFLFYVSALDYSQEENIDGYYKADTSYFESYEALYNFVNDTYVAEKAQELLNYPSKETPLYKEIDGELYVNPDVIAPVNYEVMWDDSYTLKFKSNSTSACSFEIVTTDFDGNKYVTQGAAVNQKKHWYLTDFVY
ncbi:MAG: hypothetical protein IJD68_00050 [Ruminococcus sp.]|nr:hypothetical protein [Ruminococcus sp.]